MALVETMLDLYLTRAEGRLLRLMLGIKTDHPPLRLKQVAVLVGIDHRDLRLIITQALLKFPIHRLQYLKERLGADGVRPRNKQEAAQWKALMEMVDTALTLHRRLSGPASEATAHRPSPAPVEPPPRPPSPRLPSIQPPPRPPSKAPSPSAQHQEAPPPLNETRASPHAPTPPAIPPPATAPSPFKRVQDSQPATAPRTRLQSEAIAEALEQIGRQAHYERIHARAVDILGANFPVQTTHTTLLNGRDYVALGEGVFVLARWKNRVAGADKPLLMYCPPLPIPPKARPTALFELMVRVRDSIAATTATYREVWLQSTRRLSLRLSAQDMLDLWYAVGLFPAVDFSKAQHHLAQLTLPHDLPLNAIRRHALAAVCSRIDRMPLVLRAVAEYHQPRTDQISAAAYEDARDGADIPLRLCLLEALGAIRGTPNEGWTITDSGLAALTEYPSAVVPPPTLTLSDSALAWDEYDLLDL